MGFALIKGTCPVWPAYDAPDVFWVPMMIYPEQPSSCTRNGLLVAW